MLDEAIALSLNIAPENYQYGGEAHREFVRRRFVARRNPQRIGVIRTYGVTEPVHLVALPRFAAWAQSLGWQLPIELIETIDADDRGAVIPTGMAGRPPKGRELIMAEFHRRVLNNACELALKDEADALLQWYRAEYPTADQPTLKTVENNIRAEHRQWVMTRSPETS